MNMPDMPINVQVNENEDTEWNDILRKHGVIPEKPPSPTPMIQEALEQARQLAHDNRLEGKDLDELDELEDDEDEDFLNSYRAKRFQELQTIQIASKYNQVYPVQKPEYSAEVTEASKEAWVLVLLTSSSGMNSESAKMIQVWRQLATKWGDVKFCQMQANLCIEGYPDRNTPTILIYFQGEIKKQVVTLKELNGASTGVEDVEKMLLGLGALRHGDPRLKKREEGGEGGDLNGTGRTIRQSTRQGASVEDEDDEWD